MFRFNKKIVFPILVLLVVILGLFSVSSLFYKEIPKMDAADVSTPFNGDAAYKHVETITKSYQNRLFGSSQVKACGLYVSENFKKSGLKVNFQTFSSRVPSNDKFFGKFDIVDNNVNLLSDSLSSLTENIEGTNIIGISEGQTDETIVFGAHRDMAGSIEGAEDNASGTGMLIELAKELSGKQHYYRYVFVSFDGEELMEQGSKYFVEHFNGIGKVKCALIFDQVGYKDADTLWQYTSVTGTGQTNLWIHSLTKNIFEKLKFENGYYNTDFFQTNFISSFMDFIKFRTFEKAKTDTAPFIYKKIPSIGLKSINFKNLTEVAVHSKTDTLENISAVTLKKAGDFALLFTNHLEQTKMKFGNDLTSTEFIRLGGSYLPQLNTIILMILIYLFFLILVLFGVYELKTYNFRMSFGRELMALGCSIILILSIFAFSKLLPKTLPVIVLVILWLALLVASLILIKKDVFFKNKAVGSFNMMYAKELVLLVFLFILMHLLAGFAAALHIVFIPILIIAILSVYNVKNRIIRYVLLGLWSVFHVYCSLFLINAYILNILSLKFMMISTVNLLIFISVFTTVTNNEETNQLR